MVFKPTQNFINERCAKDETFFKVYDHYRPNYHKSEITRKFYSKYEQPNLDEANPQIVEKIVLVMDKGPKEKTAWPETSNQEYGWFITPLVNVDRNDRRYYQPRVIREVTKHIIVPKKVKSK